MSMRTTLAIDDDVLAAAKGLAEQQGRSLGEVISSLARRGLQPRSPPSKTRNGLPLLPVGSAAKPVNLELVNRLRDELP
jgi:hypothetical protein